MATCPSSDHNICSRNSIPRGVYAARRSASWLNPRGHPISRKRLQSKTLANEWHLRRQLDRTHDGQLSRSRLLDLNSRKPLADETNPRGTISKYFERLSPNPAYCPSSLKTCYSRNRTPNSTRPRRCDARPRSSRHSPAPLFPSGDGARPWRTRKAWHPRR
jgi:hypothetical protein